MKRLADSFVDKIETVLKLNKLEILEIGCGNGFRSVKIADRCKKLTAIEPGPDLIRKAQENNSRKNILYQSGKAEKLDFPNESFDAAIFTLSFHHIPFAQMTTALDEAVRVVKRGGHIIFLEPGTRGTFFEVELQFGASDGDERKEKAGAYYSILTYDKYKEIAELMDETIIQFDSEEDFIKSLEPDKNLEVVKDFLQKNNYIVNAERRINIFKKP